MTAPVTVTRARSYTAVRAAQPVSARFFRVLGWSAFVVALGPIAVPLGALHALSHVLEVHREDGPWSLSVVALALGVALAVTGTGVKLGFGTAYDSSSVDLELRVVDRTVAKVGGVLNLDSGISLSWRGRLGARAD